MRDILFRGKRIDNGEWVCGSFCMDALEQTGAAEAGVMDGFIRRFDTHTKKMKMHEVDRQTVGQYTGLTDKNGAKIFEGDIVRYVYEPGEGFWNANQNSIIQWKSTGYFMEGIRGTNKYALMSGWLTTVPHGNGSLFEVIGNIYDNPDLLGDTMDMKKEV